MVLDGRVRNVDMLGNDAADEAADFGRRRVGNVVIDARRNLSGVCCRWYPVLLDLHRFFIAISRSVVNLDGRGVQLLILLFGLLVLVLKGVDWFMLFRIGLFCPGLVFGIRSGLQCIWPFLNYSHDSNSIFWAQGIKSEWVSGGTVRMGILFGLLKGGSVFGSRTRFVFLKLRVMLMRPWLELGELVILIG